MRLIAIALSLLVGWMATALSQDWQPTEAQKTAAMRTANAYFEMIDKGRYDVAYSMLAPSVKATATEEQYVRFWTDNKRRAGNLQQRKILRVTWYPTGSAEGTGVAAAVDYEGAFDRSNVYCGYLALIEMPGGVFDLLRDDMTLATTELIRQMPPAVRIQTFNRPGCRRFLLDDE